MYSLSKLCRGTWSNSSVGLLDTGKISLTSLLLSEPPLRHRYFVDKPRILPRKYGYKDKLDFKGPLPRIPTGMPLPMPVYQPKKCWSEQRALFGQNDYIDILGDVEGVKPIQFQTHIPAWLRGFRGNEFQMLLRKKALLGSRIVGRPMEWHNLKKRMKYLYRTLNYNTRNFMDKQVLRR